MAQITFRSMADSSYLWTAMQIADEKGVSYELAILELYSEEHFALHPFGKMPVMQHGDVTLYESIAIAHYINRAFEGPALQPHSPAAQAHVLRWLSIVNAYVFPTMNKFTKERLVRAAWGVEPDAAFVQAAREPLMRQMRIIERTLTSTPFLVGDALTLADCFLLPNVLFFAKTPEGEGMVQRSPGICAWMARMTERPSFARNPMPVALEAMQLMRKSDELAWSLD